MELYTMNRKILILCGSPRKNGNTNTLVKWVKAAAVNVGAEVECIDVVRLKYKTHGCTACMACQKSDKFECVLEDDASPILRRIPEYDTLVIATPVYCYGPTAQLKVFTDRMQCLIKFNPETNEFRHNLAGKTMALIATAGGDYDENLKLLEMLFSTFANSLGMKFESLLEPFAPHDPQQMQKRTELREKAAAFGSRLLMRASNKGN
ncbi:MAG: flavodoxin family protein [Planctomycetota bacterium]